MLHTVMLAETHGSLPAGQCPSSPFFWGGCSRSGSYCQAWKRDERGSISTAALRWTLHPATASSLERSCPTSHSHPNTPLASPGVVSKGVFCTSEVSTGSWLSPGAGGDVVWDQGPLALLSSAVFLSKSSRSISGIPAPRCQNPHAFRSLQLSQARSGQHLQFRKQVPCEPGAVTLIDL